MSGVEVADFEPALSAVVVSADTEITGLRQSALAEYGEGVRSMLRLLPRPAVEGVISEYGAAPPSVLEGLQTAVAMRERLIESVEEGANLDQTWLAGAGAGRAIDEDEIGNKDPWNMPA